MKERKQTVRNSKLQSRDITTKERLFFLSGSDSEFLLYIGCAGRKEEMVNGTRGAPERESVKLCESIVFHKHSLDSRRATNRRQLVSDLLKEFFGGGVVLTLHAIYRERGVNALWIQNRRAKRDSLTLCRRSSKPNPWSSSCLLQ